MFFVFAVAKVHQKRIFSKKRRNKTKKIRKNVSNIWLVQKKAVPLHPLLKKRVQSDA